MALSYGYDEFTMEADIDMDTRKITNLPDTEPVTKKYADNNYAGGGPTRHQGHPGNTGPQGPNGHWTHQAPGPTRTHRGKGPQRLALRFLETWRYFLGVID